MRRPIEKLEDLLRLVVIEPRRQRYRARLYHKALAISRPMRGHQAQAQQTIYRSLERFTGPANLLLKKAGNIFIDGKRRSHITMLAIQTS